MNFGVMIHLQAITPTTNTEEAGMHQIRSVVVFRCGTIHHLGSSPNVLLYVKEEPRSCRSYRETPEACHQALTVGPLSVLWVWPVGRIREMISSRGYSLPMVLKQSDIIERVNIEYIVLPNERRRLT
jgi:hypothetical protein